MTFAQCVVKIFEKLLNPCVIGYSHGNYAKIK